MPRFSGTNNTNGYPYNKPAVTKAHVQATSEGVVIGLANKSTYGGTVLGTTNISNPTLANLADPFPGDIFVTGADTIPFTSAVSFATSLATQSLSITDTNFAIAGDFTIEFWAATTTITAGIINAPIKISSGTSNYLHICAATNMTTNWCFQAVGLGSTTTSNYNTSAPYLDTAINGNSSLWEHIAVTREGLKYRMFVNGVLAATKTDTVASALTTGATTVELNSSYIGKLSNVRIMVGIALYNNDTGFTPSYSNLTTTQTTRTGVQASTDATKCKFLALTDASSIIYEDSSTTQMSESRTQRLFKVSTIGVPSNYKLFYNFASATWPGFTSGDFTDGILTGSLTLNPTTSYNTALLTCTTGTAGTSTFTDMSDNPLRNALTVTGAVSLDTTTVPFTGAVSASFPAGTGTAYITIPSSVTTGDHLLLGSGDFTVEFWCYLKSITNATSTSPNSAVLYMVDGANNYWCIDYSAYYSSTSTVNNWQFRTSVLPSGAPLLNSGVPPIINQWVHIAVVSSSTSGNFAMYIDGIRKATFSYGTSPLNQSTGLTLYIGRYASNLLLSNLRITKGSTIYTGVGNFTPQTTTLTAEQNTVPGQNEIVARSSTVTNLLLFTNSLSYLTRISGNAIDSSLYNNQFSRTIPTGTTLTPGYVTVPSLLGGTYGYLYHTNTYYDYVSGAYRINNDLKNTDFTIECWLYLLVGDVKRGIITTANSTYGTFSFHINANNYLEFQTIRAGVPLTTITSTLTVPKYTWTHVAVVVKNTALSFYLNGVSNSGYTVGSFIFSGNENDVGFIIGISSGGINPTRGIISNLRVSRLALYTQATEILPTEPLTIIGSKAGTITDPIKNYSYIYKIASGGTIVTAGSFVTGKYYMIVSTGTTVFTSIGALVNDPGTVFVASGIGSGTGQAVDLSTAITEGNETFAFNVSSVNYQVKATALPVSKTPEVTILDTLLTPITATKNTAVPISTKIIEVVGRPSQGWQLFSSVTGGLGRNFGYDGIIRDTTYNASQRPATGLVVNYSTGVLSGTPTGAPNLVTPNQLIVGQPYTIYSNVSFTWTTVGSVNNNIGTNFVATATSTSTTVDYATSPVSDVTYKVTVVQIPEVTYQYAIPSSANFAIQIVTQLSLSLITNVIASSTALIYFVKDGTSKTVTGIQISGGTGPGTYSLVSPASPALPNNLTASVASDKINLVWTGTSTNPADNSSQYTLAVRDVATPYQEKTQAVTIRIVDPLVLSLDSDVTANDSILIPTYGAGSGYLSTVYLVRTNGAVAGASKTLKIIDFSGGTGTYGPTPPTVRPNTTVNTTLPVGVTTSFINNTIQLVWNGASATAATTSTSYTFTVNDFTETNTVLQTKTQVVKIRIVEPLVIGALSDGTSTITSGVSSPVVYFIKTYTNPDNVTGTGVSKNVSTSFTQALAPGGIFPTPTSDPVLPNGFTLSSTTDPSTGSTAFTIKWNPTSTAIADNGTSVLYNIKVYDVAQFITVPLNISVVNKLFLTLDTTVIASASTVMYLVRTNGSIAGTSKTIRGIKISGGTSTLSIVNPTLATGFKLTTSIVNDGTFNRLQLIWDGTSTAAVDAGSSYTFTVNDKTNTNAILQTATQSVKLRVVDPLVLSVPLSNIYYIKGVAKTAVSVITISGGLSTYTQSVSPALPTGLTATIVSTTNIQISAGTVPTTVSADPMGTLYTFTVNDQSQQTKTQAMTLVVVDTLSASIVTNQIILIYTSGGQPGISSTTDLISVLGGTGTYSYVATADVFTPPYGSTPPGVTWYFDNNTLKMDWNGSTTGTSYATYNTPVYSFTISDRTDTNSILQTVLVSSGAYIQLLFYGALALSAPANTAVIYYIKTIAKTTTVGITISGGSGSYRQTVSPALPSNLTASIVSNAIQIAGTVPDTVYADDGISYTFTVSNPTTAQTKTQAITLRVVDLLVVTLDTGAIYFVRTNGSIAGISKSISGIIISGGILPYVLSSPTLPAKLTASITYGFDNRIELVWDGTSTAAADNGKSYTFTVTDKTNTNATLQTKTQAVTIRIVNPLVLSVPASTVYYFAKGVNKTADIGITISGGSGQYTTPISVSPSLPNGLTASVVSSKITITGTVQNTVAVNSGISYIFTVTDDSEQTKISGAVTLRVVDPLTVSLNTSIIASSSTVIYLVTPYTNYSSAPGIAKTITGGLQISGGLQPYSLGTVSLPNGLTATVSGTNINLAWSSTSTAGGGSSFIQSIPVSDNSTQTASQNITLQIVNALSVAYDNFSTGISNGQVYDAPSAPTVYLPTGTTQVVRPIIITGGINHTVTVSPALSGLTATVNYDTGRASVNARTTYLTWNGISASANSGSVYTVTVNSDTPQTASLTLKIRVIKPLSVTNLTTTPVTYVIVGVSATINLLSYSDSTGSYSQTNTGLPPGITASIASGKLKISGTATDATWYIDPLQGGSTFTVNSLSATGTVVESIPTVITVLAAPKLLLYYPDGTTSATITDLYTSYTGVITQPGVDAVFAPIFVNTEQNSLWWTGAGPYTVTTSPSLAELTGTVNHDDFNQRMQVVLSWKGSTSTAPGLGVSTLYTITVKDGANQSQTKQITLRIVTPLVFTSTYQIAGWTGASRATGTITLAVTGGYRSSTAWATGNTGLNWSYSAGSAANDNGLTFSINTSGVLSYVLPASIVSPFSTTVTVTVSDYKSQTASIDIPINIQNRR